MRRIVKGIYDRMLLALPPMLCLRLQHISAHGAWPDLHHPKTFNEKVQYRKLFDPDPRFVLLADKVEAKKIVRDILGEDWITPTIWDGPRLPPRKSRRWPIPFVIKANHASGWNYFVRKQSDLDWDRLERIVARWDRPYVPQYYETFYNEMPRRLLVEPIVGDDAGLKLWEYKFFVFGGRVEFIDVHTDRFTAHKRAVYDRNWKRQGFWMKFPWETVDIEPTRHLEQMIWAAETLGREFSFVRVDLYDLPKPKFGEMTFMHGSGFQRFYPPSVDRVFGDLWPFP